MISVFVGGFLAVLMLAVGETALNRMPDIVYQAARVRPIRTAVVFLLLLGSWPISIPFAYWWVWRKEKENEEIQARRVGCMAVSDFGARCEFHWNHDSEHSFEYHDYLAAWHRSDELFWRTQGDLDKANYYRELADSAEKGLNPVYWGFFP